MVSYNLPFSHLLKYNQTHGKDGRFSSGVGGGVSATGAKKFSKGFKEANLDKHWKKHSEEFSRITKAQYAQKALSLAQKAVGGDVLGYETEDGNIVRFEKSTKHFVSGHPSKGIFTMMNLNYKNDNGNAVYVGPQRAMKRFNALKRRDEKKEVPKDEK